MPRINPATQHRVAQVRQALASYGIDRPHIEPTDFGTLQMVFPTPRGEPRDRVTGVVIGLLHDVGYQAIIANVDEREAFFKAA